MDRLHESLAKYGELTLKIKMASEKEKLDVLKIEVSGVRVN